jgi:succinate dehydrogenase hydrophobic anchor subunit
LGWVYVLLLLLFPTGRLPSPRWRPVAWALVTGFVVTLISQGLKPGSLVDYSGEQNPFGTPALRPVLGPLEQLARVLVIGGIIGAFASLAVRLRRSRGRERQQLKWFVYVALVGIVAIFPLGALLGSLIGQLPSSYGTVLGFLLHPWLLAPVALAVTVAAAIVRHRLYDIDRVVNRTLVYALLSLLLGAVYTAGVFVLGRLLAQAMASPSWRSPPPPSPSRRCSGQPEDGSSAPSTGASTGLATTPPRPSRPSAPGSGTKLTWTGYRPSCWRSSTRLCSQHKSHFGCGP